MKVSAGKVSAGARGGCTALCEPPLFSASAVALAAAIWRTQAAALRRAAPPALVTILNPTQVALRTRAIGLMGSAKDLAGTLVRTAQSMWGTGETTSGTGTVGCAISRTAKRLRASGGAIGATARAASSTLTVRSTRARCRLPRHGLCPLPLAKLPFRYAAQFADGKRSGRGMMRYANGDLYEGEWRAGRRNGTGCMRTADGETYEGQWRDDRPGGGPAEGVEGGVRPRYVDGVGLVGVPASGHAEAAAAAVGGEEADGRVSAPQAANHGECTYADGSSYAGGWLLGLRHGVGTHKSADGSSYHGEWANDMRHGHGVLSRPGELEFDGEWWRDAPHGTGCLTLANNERLEGRWQDGSHTGRMQLTRTNNDVYVGMLCCSAPAGSVIHSAGSMCGSYEPHGRGRMEYAAGDVYDGDWEAGEPTGFGSFTWTSGDAYSGDVRGGAPLGEGAFRFANGDTYRGEMSGLQRHGVGVCTYASGAVYEGTWRDDAWHTDAGEAERCVFRAADGARFPFVTPLLAPREPVVSAAASAIRVRKRVCGSLRQRRAERRRPRAVPQRRSVRGRAARSRKARAGRMRVRHRGVAVPGAVAA